MTSPPDHGARPSSEPLLSRLAFSSLGSRLEISHSLVQDSPLHTHASSKEVQLHVSLTVLDVHGYGTCYLVWSHLIIIFSRMQD